MQLAARRDENEYWSARIANATRLRPPFAGEPYVCLLWAGEAANVAEQSAVAEVLLASNCAWVVCGGVACEQWHDVIDEVAAIADRFLTTTWHEGESIEEVAWFFANAALAAKGRTFRRFLALAVDSDPASEVAVAAAVRTAIGSEGVV